MRSDLSGRYVMPVPRNPSIAWARARAFVARMDLAVWAAKPLMMAWFTVYQSRVLSRLGPWTVVPLREAQLRLDLTEMHDVRVYAAMSHRGAYEPETSALLAELLTRGDSFVDVGANNGYFTVLASQLVGPTGTVLAVEPNPRALERLEQNLRLNGLDHQVRVVSAAAGHREGTRSLYVSGFEDGWASLVPDPSAREVVRVQVVPLDGLLTGLRTLVLKIDAEGSEPEILRGLDQVLRSSESVAVILEWNRKFSSAELWHHLRERFRVRQIVPAAVEPGFALEEIRRWEQLRDVLVSNLLLTSGPRWDRDLGHGASLGEALRPSQGPVGGAGPGASTGDPATRATVTSERDRMRLEAAVLEEPP